MLRTEKEAIVSNIQSVLERSAIALCVDYRGLNVNEIMEFRKKIKGAGGQAVVLKNKLLYYAFTRAFNSESDEIGSQEQRFVDILNGPTMLVVGDEDPIAPTKVIVEQAKQLEALEIKGGFLDGEFITDSRIDQLSKLPGREEVLGQLLRTLMAPATNLARLVNEPASQLARVVRTYGDQLSA